MSFATTWFVRYCVPGDGSRNGSVASGEQPDQVLEVRLSHGSRLISRSPSAGLSNQILQETPSPLMANALFPLPLRELEDPFFCQIYVVQLLSSLNLRAATCNAIARSITSLVAELAAGGNYEANFHIVANVDCIEVIWTDRSPRLYPVPRTLLEETVILDALPASRGAPESAIGRLRKEKFEGLVEELGDCSVCYDELKGGKEEVKRMPCGHLYHESCIVRWLKKNNSCPLCRRQLEE